MRAKIFIPLTVLFLGGLLLAPFGSAWAAQGSFLADKHKARGVNCAGCHKENPPKQKVPMAACLRCHGDYGKLKAKTEKTEPNPHDSHLGEVDCAKCHRGHKASINACAACHPFDYQVP